MAHIHHHDESESRNAIAVAFFLNLTFTLIEIAGGLWTNSLAILSDALHDLGDSLSLGISWVLEGYSLKKQDRKYSYGYRRYSLLAALINTIVLIVGSVFIIMEAIPRLMNPQQPNAPGMVLVALVGVAVNGLAVLRLRGHSGMNARSMALHLLEDVIGWVAVLIVALVLTFWNAPILDPLLSIAITGFVLFNVFKILRSTVALFLQAVPEKFDIPALEQQIMKMEDVESIHHTHVWSLDGSRHVLTTHIVVAECATRESVMRLKSSVKELTRDLGLQHTTVEIEYEKADCSMFAAD